MRRSTVIVAFALLLVALFSRTHATAVAPAQQAGSTGYTLDKAGSTGIARMSANGRRALARRAQYPGAVRPLNMPTGAGGDACVNEPDCGEDEGHDDELFEDGPASAQAETSIAVDSTGMHVVIGMNDFRGFSTNPLSASGFMYSDDGGATFTDGGQLPVNCPAGSPANCIGTVTSIGGSSYPQIFGDPDVKYLGGCTFIYSSILLKQVDATHDVQTMSIHRSTDCGHTWVGPFEVRPVTNPNGLIDTNGFPVDAADKELMDVDPDTGRVMISWSNFTPVAAGGVEISITFSDDGGITWAPRRVIAATPVDGQGSVPRFAGNGSNNVYVAWTRFPSFYTNAIGFSRSTDNGATWSAPVNAAGAFVTIDQVLGNDRVNTNPSLAVDHVSGSIYLAYTNNNTFDGGDVAFRRSTDGGLTFTPATFVNAKPGGDRTQWFPYVSVDHDTGRLHLFYYDQGVATSGDLTEASWMFSDDGGVSWQKPNPLTPEPFHAGHGNDTGQPNLGDYIQSLGRLGELFAAYAIAEQKGFTDGQPSLSMTTPDVAFTRTASPRVALRFADGAPAFTDSGGNGLVDAGDQIKLNLPLVNYVTNPLNASTVTGVSGVLSTTTPDVTILQGTSTYPDLPAGTTQTNAKAYVLKLAPTFVPGTRVDLLLSVTSAQGSTVLPRHLNTGTPVTTTLLQQDFDGVAAGTLPAGWSSAHGGGTNTVPWTTSSTFCGGSNAAFHQEANDAANPTRWERLFSPLVNVPAGAQYVTIDMDVCYDTEDDPVLARTAYDGLVLRLAQTAPLAAGVASLRSVLAEAFAEQITTGSIFHYPKHLPRGNNPAYFEDMSVWAGASSGSQHVTMRLPGMADTQFQMRFEYTQDSNGLCSDLRPGHACGVQVDNVVIRSVVTKSDELDRLRLTAAPTTPGTFSGVVTSQAVAPPGGILVLLSSSRPDKTTMPASITIPAGATTSAPFTVSLDPAFRGTPVTITATGPSNARTATIVIR